MNDSIILGIETSSEACSAALRINNKIIERYKVGSRHHSHQLLSMINEICYEASLNISEITGFAFGEGPGSFTGLRIAAAVIQGLAFGLNKPIVGIPTHNILAYMAYQKYKSDRILVVVDARMNEVYWGSYNFNNGISMESFNSRISVQDPREVSLTSDHYVGVGSGCLLYKDILTDAYPNLSIDTDLIFPRAKVLVELAEEFFSNGKAKLAEDAIPIYIRNEVVRKNNN